MQFWTDSNKRILFFSVVLIALFVFGYWLSPVLNPFLIALGIAYILNPVIGGLERKNIPRLGTVFGIFSVFLVSFLLFFLFTVPNLIKQVSDVPAALFEGEGATWIDKNKNGVPDFSKDSKLMEFDDWNGNGKLDGGYIDRMITWVEEKIGKDRNQLELIFEKQLRTKETMETLQEILAVSLGKFRDNATDYLSKLFNLITVIILIPVYTFFLMLEYDKIISTARKYLPGAYREKILSITGQIDEAVSGFFRGRLLICMIIAISAWIGLMICGIRFNGIIALLTGISVLVPLLWIPLGLVPAILFEYSDYGFAWQTIGVLVVFAIVQVADSVLQPIILGKSVGLHPVILILSIFLFGSVFGLFGVLLAVPLACIAIILIKEFLVPVLEAYAVEEKTRTGQGVE